MPGPVGVTEPVGVTIGPLQVPPAGEKPARFWANGWSQKVTSLPASTTGSGFTVIVRVAVVMHPFGSANVYVSTWAGPGGLRIEVATAGARTGPRATHRCSTQGKCRPVDADLLVRPGIHRGGWHYRHGGLCAGGATTAAHGVGDYERACRHRREGPSDGNVAVP